MVTRTHLAFTWSGLLVGLSQAACIAVANPKVLNALPFWLIVVCLLASALGKSIAQKPTS